MGTIDDVVCFDGEHFYSLRQYGFPKETPNGFAEDREGGIWIATQGTDVSGGTGRGGLYRYQAGHVEKLFSGDGLSIVAAAPGIMLAAMGTELQGKPAFGDLLRFAKGGDSWKPERMMQRSANHLTVDHQGNVLFPCPGGWCELSRQEVVSWRGPDQRLDVRQHTGSPLLERVLRDRFGCVWFRAEAFAAYQCPGDTQVKPISAGISQYDNSAHLEEAPDGSIFMLVYLALGRPGSFHLASERNGLPQIMDTAIVGKDGTIWIGAESGLYRFMYPFQVEYWDKENGASIPYSILRVGNKVFASDQTSFDGAIRQLNANRAEWDRIPGPAGLGGVLAEGPHGTLFAATRYYLAQFSPRQGMLSHVVVADYDAGFSLARASEQELWLGGKGISRVAVHGKELRLSPEAVPNDGVPDMKYDAIRHTLWACDGSTLLYRRDGRWGSITPKDGLLDRGCSTVAIEGNGDLWMGYTSAAFSWIHDPASGHPTVRNYTQWLNNIVGNVIVANDSIHFLSPDQRGWLWRANDALYLAAPEAAKAGEWLRLDERDGLSPPTPRAFEKDMDGSVWFGTSLGIVHFSPPDDFATRFPSPPIFVAGFSVGNSVPRMADAMGRIPHGVDVVAHIGSLQFDRRNALRVRYRLLPGQAGWTNAPSLDLRLGKLRWGRHTLQVQAQLASGPWSSVSEQSFTVLAPVWLSWPALLLMAVGGASLAFGSAQWRKQQRFKREAVLPDMTAWRMSALSPETEELIGTVLDGRYEIGHILSVGGFATVARARDLQDGGKLRAVKIFRHELADQD